MNLKNFGCLVLASTLFTRDICAGDRYIINCNNTVNPQSIVFENAFYGIQNPGVSICGYTPNDCGEELTLTHCGFNNSTCIVTAGAKRIINKCSNKIANYFNIKYYCVPFSTSNIQSTYDVCSSGEITQSNGFITSPGYPTFKAQNITCIKKIRVPIGKSISIWTVDSKFGIRDSFGECSTNYVKISDTTYPNDFCGDERKPFYKQFCSNVIYISYLANDYSDTFRGFKLYFETYDVSAQSGCPTGTPSYPVSTTTMSTTPGRIPGLASPIYSLRICAGQPSQTIRAPIYNLVFVESYVYGVPSSLTCENDYSPNHCIDEEPLPCNLKTSCTFQLGNVTATECGNQQAQYLYVTYRFIPTSSTNKYLMCQDSTVNADTAQYGLITSKNYPRIDQYADCTLNIVSNDLYKAFKVYITDIAIENPDTNEVCSNDVLRLSDGISGVLENCGYTKNQGTYSYTSCSNSLKIQYSTGSTNTFFYRGFKLYYETIDRPNLCSSPSLKTTQSGSTTKLTTFNPNFDIFSSILSTDQNGEVKPCVFPFKYKNQYFNECINLDQSFNWCSLTFDYDTDKQLGKCDRGFTSNVQFEICTKSSRTFSCPAGYVIYVVSAEVSATTDGSCDYNKKKCSESFQDIITYANGKNTLKYYALSKVLTNCGNVPSNLVHIDYKCLPSTSNTFKKYEFCLNGQDDLINTPNGIIQTPNYPTYSSQLNCSFKYNSNDKKHNKIYAVNIDLETVASSKECENYYLQVNDEKKMCGIKSTVLIHESCSNSFQVKIKTSTKPYKGVRLFYESTAITSTTLCPQTEEPTVTTTSSLVSTTPIPKPIWAENGIASPLLFQDLCLTSSTISCPANYTIVIRDTFYGISPDRKCFYSQDDCVSYEPLEGLDCSGKQSCKIPYKIKYLPECSNKLSNYIRVTYECIPDFYPKVSMCNTNEFTDSKGFISSPDYPNFITNQNCETNINTKPNTLIRLYFKDLSLDTNCSSESLTLTTSELLPQAYCGELGSFFAIETCSNSLKLNLVTKNNVGDKRGVLMYYEEIPKPIGFVCPSQTTSRAPATTTKSLPPVIVTTTPTRPVYYGFSSPLLSLISCGPSKISCPADHYIIVESSVYGVHNRNLTYCSSENDDCQAAYPALVQLCSGYQNCSISFSPQLYTVTSCNRAKADYFEIIYRCIPTREAGNPLKLPNQLCTENYSLSSGASALFQSPNFPNYPTNAVTCSFNITSIDKLKVYINTARFQGTGSLCTSAKDYLSVSDGVSTFTFCNNANNAKYLLESRSNWITVSYATTRVTFLNFFKGFQIYVEGYKEKITTQSPPGSTRPPANDLIITANNGFSSAIIHDEICARQQKNLICPINYILLTREEALVDTNGNGCSHNLNGKECIQPSNILTNECSNKQNCSLFFPETEITRCYSQYADLLHYEVQCVPNSLPDRTYTCLDKQINVVSNGIVTSPNYPQYVGGILADECSLKLTPPPNKALRFFINHLSLSTSQQNGGCGSDYLLINDDFYCGSSQAQLAYTSSDSRTVVVRFNSLNISEVAQQQQLQDLRGFKLFFEIYDVEKTTTKQPVETSTLENIVIAIRPSKLSGKLLLYSSVTGLPIILVLLVVVVILARNNKNVSTSTMTNIKYSKEASDLHSFSNPLAASNDLYDNADLRRNENY